MTKLFMDFHRAYNGQWGILKQILLQCLVFKGIFWVQYLLCTNLPMLLYRYEKDEPSSAHPIIAQDKSFVLFVVYNLIVHYYFAFLYGKQKEWCQEPYKLICLPMKILNIFFLLHQKQSLNNNLVHGIP